ncbi:MAG: S1 family peptidase [Oleiphilaceae bacterium]|nr:S1 family peptidase [Oleiphilaceae bacterium]
MKTSIFLFFILVWPCLASSAVVDATQPPWNVIGKLRVEAKQSCTATLVSPDTVLTAAHCIYDYKTRSYFSPNKIHFLAGLNAGALVAQSEAMSYTVAAKHLPEGTFDDQALLKDWALVRLRYPVGCMLGHMKPGDHTNSFRRFMIAGYPKSDPSRIHAEQSCKLALPPKKNQMIRIKDCAVEHGDSGAALVGLNGNKATLLGVLSAATNDSKGRFRAFVVPSDAFLKSIKKLPQSCEKLMPEY